MHLFKRQHIISKNLIYFIRLNGYTISSLARLSCIPKTDFEKILSGEVADPIYYDEQIKGITKSLNLANDYFLQKPTDRMNKWFFSDPVSSERSDLAQELLDDLDDLISVCGFYIKN